MVGCGESPKFEWQARGHVDMAVYIIDVGLPFPALVAIVSSVLEIVCGVLLLVPSLRGTPVLRPLW